MKFFSLLALLLLPRVFGIDEVDCTAPDSVTQLDFFQAELVTNTLHLAGGELRYEGTFSWMPGAVGFCLM